MKIRSSYFFSVLLFLTSPPIVKVEAQYNFSKEELLMDAMMFTENKGQVVDQNKNLRPDILFSGRANGATIFLRKEGVSFVFTDAGRILSDFKEDADEEWKKNVKEHKGRGIPFDSAKFNAEKVTIQRIDMDFLNCNSNAEIIKNSKVQGYDNFYFPHCSQGILRVPSYKEITYKNFYDNVDVVYSGMQETGLEYNIIVNPGGDISKVQILFSGSSFIKKVNNELQLETELGSMVEFSPTAYQEINGEKIFVNTNYKFTKLSDNTAIVQFVIPSYNTSYPLIIDPWITYYGGTGDEYATNITADPSGNIEFTGHTTSADFPVSSGAFQTTLPSVNGSPYVVKMDANGNRIFGTYFGGSGSGSFSEIGTAICADAFGNIYVAGNACSADFPVGAVSGNVVHQNTISIDIADAFLAKFDPFGARLWATFFGGDSIDDAAGVAVDKNTNTVILFGYTSSHNGICTPGTFQTTNHGNQDAFVAKFATDGSRLWGTYVGGSLMEGASWGGYGWCGNTCCDNTGNIYICGTTMYTFDTTSVNDFPVLAGHQMSFGGGYTDAFLTKLDPAGTNIIWSTFYGGYYVDYGFSVATDGTDNVILGGYTGSVNAISTAGSCQQNMNGFDDGFLAKFNSNGTRLWATYLGGSDNSDQGVGGLACDVNNNIVTAGDTYCTDFPITNCAYQKTFEGSEDQFITTFRSDGTMLCSGYLGVGDIYSPNNETVQTQCIAVYGCYVYLYAFTNCNYPVTPGAFQTSCSVVTSVWEAAVAKLFLNTCGGINSSIDFSIPDTICIGQSIDFASLYSGCDTSGIAYQWEFPGGTPSSSTSATPTGVTYNVTGAYDVKLVISLNCGKDSLIKQNAVIVDDCLESKLEVFNVFTPNGDGYNDTYHVKYQGTFEKFNMKIFNRWGRLMFETGNIDQGWDCSDCSDGTYFYIITALGDDGKKYNLHGTVTIIK